MSKDRVAFKLTAEDIKQKRESEVDITGLFRLAVLSVAATSIDPVLKQGIIQGMYNNAEKHLTEKIAQEAKGAATFSSKTTPLAY